MSFQEVNKILKIDGICYGSYPDKHNVKFLNKSSKVCNTLLDSKIIWNFLKDNLDNTDYNTFKYFSNYCDDKNLVKEIENKLLKNLKNKGNVINKISNVFDIIYLKHSYPGISYTKKSEFTSNQLLSKFCNIDLVREKDNYISKWKNTENYNYFFKSIKLLDDNDNLIENYKIEELTFYINDKEIITWYGNLLLENENFEMGNLFPLYSNNCNFKIKTDFKISQAYIYICYELPEVTKQKYFSNSFLDYDYKKLYEGDISEEVEINVDKGYFQDIRICLIDLISGMKINPSIIKRISISDIIENIPTSLLNNNNDLLVYDYGYNIIKYDNSTGFILNDCDKIKLEFRDKIYDLDCHNIILKIYGKQHVYHTLSKVSDNFQNETNIII